MYALWFINCWHINLSEAWINDAGTPPGWPRSQPGRTQCLKLSELHAAHLKRMASASRKCHFFYFRLDLKIKGNTLCWLFELFFKWPVLLFLLILSSYISHNAIQLLADMLVKEYDAAVLYFPEHWIPQPDLKEYLGIICFVYFVYIFPFTLTNNSISIFIGNICYFILFMYFQSKPFYYSKHSYGHIKCALKWNYSPNLWGKRYPIDISSRPYTRYQL